MRPRPGPVRIETSKHIKKRNHTEWYGFFLTGNFLSSQAASSQVLSTYRGLTTVFGMGTGGSPQLSSPDYFVEGRNPQNFTEEKTNDLVRACALLSQALDILVPVS